MPNILRPLTLVLLLPMIAPAQEPDPNRLFRNVGTGIGFESVVDIRRHHHEELLRELIIYLDHNPQAYDVEEAYMLLFETAIDLDGFERVESHARQYLKAQPNGPSAPLAQIVTIQTDARADRFREALLGFKRLMITLGSAEHEPFALSFAGTLSDTALAAGQDRITREIFQTLLDRFPGSQEIQDRAFAEFDRLSLIGQPAPELEATDLDGQSLRLSDLNGKPVYVVFWATWCVPCVNDFPDLQAVYDQYHDQGFEILGISLDETPDEAKEFLQAAELPWHQIHNATSGVDWVDAFKINVLPASCFIHPDGTITRLNVRGEGSGELVESSLKK